MPTAFPSITPSQASQLATEPAMISVKYGNGYEQRMADGINAIRDKWQLTFEALNATNLSTLRTFLQSISGGDYTTWTSPLDSSSKKYVLDGGWNVQVLSGGVYYTLTFSLRQVFDA